MSSTRCKAFCSVVEQLKRDDGTVYQERITLCGVYSDDPNSENKWFASATPCFQTSMTIDNPAAFGTFIQGEEYYVDFTHAPKPSPAPVALTEDAVTAPADEALPTGADAAPDVAPATAEACPTCDQAAKAEAPAPEAPAPAPEAAPAAPETPPQAS